MDQDPIHHAVLQVALLPGHHGDRHRRAARPLLPRDGHCDEAAGRRLHQADQDDHRADHLLHRGGRHRRHGRHEEGRQDGWLCAAVFRDRQHDRTDRRPGDRQPGAAGRGHEHRPGVARQQVHRRLHRARQDADDHRVPARGDPDHGGRCFRQGRDAAGADVLDAVRLRAAPLRRPRHAGVRLHREVLARAVRDRRLHHEGGPDRRVRRDGLHDRQVRPGLADPAGQADGYLLRHLPGVHLRRARRHRQGCTAFRS